MKTLGRVQRMLALILFAAPAFAQRGAPVVLPGQFPQQTIGRGQTLWFSSAVHVTGAAGGPGKIYLRNSSIHFKLRGVPHTVEVPNATVTFSTTAGEARARYTEGEGWETVVPAGTAEGVFLSGVKFEVQDDLGAGAIEDVTWRGSFFADRPGASLQWQWRALAVRGLSAGLPQLRVRPVSTRSGCANAVWDLAGAPSSWQRQGCVASDDFFWLLAGASETALVHPAGSSPPPAPVAEAVDPKLNYIPRGSTVALDGRGSGSPRGGALRYRWSFVSKPKKSRATLSGADTATPSFTGDREGYYHVQLTVNDGVAESSPALVQVTVSVNLLELERKNIERIVEFSRKEDAGIFFLLPENPPAYAKSGTLHWLRLKRSKIVADIVPAAKASWIAIAQQNDRGGFEIAVYDLEKEAERAHIPVSCSPSNVGWTHDDEEVVALCANELLVLSVATGEVRSRRAAVPPPEYRQGWQWRGGLGGLSDGSFLLDLEYQVSVSGEPGTWMGATAVFRLAPDGSATRIAEGSTPALSPSGDRVAYYAGHEVVVSAPDGTSRRSVSKPPWSLLYLHELMSPLTWSPRGERLIFHDWTDWERGIGGAYVVDVKTGERKTLLKDSTISIVGWK